MKSWLSNSVAVFYRYWPLSGKISGQAASSRGWLAVRSFCMDLSNQPSKWRLNSKIRLIATHCVYNLVYKIKVRNRYLVNNVPKARPSESVPLVLYKNRRHHDEVTAWTAFPLCGKPLIIATWTPSINGPLMRGFGVLNVAVINKRLNKQSICRLFESPWNAPKLKNQYCVC